MATKLKGLTSLEIAIIVAIVLVIAIAVGWYLYTTFVASTASQGRLAISSAEYFLEDNNLRLVVTNPGPQPVKIKERGIFLHGKNCMNSSPYDVNIGETETITIYCHITPTPAAGTMLSGYVITTAGTTFTFNAIVRFGRAT